MIRRNNDIRLRRDRRREQKKGERAHAPPTRRPFIDEGVGFPNADETTPVPVDALNDRVCIRDLDALQNHRPPILTEVLEARGRRRRTIR